MEKIEPVAFIDAAQNLRMGKKREEGNLYSQATIDQLVRERDDWQDFCKASRLDHEATREQLSATEALCQKYREALEYVIRDLELRASLNPDQDERDIVAIGDGAYCQAKEALATPSPTAALNNAIADELERMAENVTVWLNLVAPVRYLVRDGLNNRAKELREEGK